MQNKINSESFINSEFSKLKISNYNFKNKTSKFDLIFTFIEKEELDLVIQYDTDVYDAPYIERMFGHFENLMTILIEQPGILIGNADHLSKNEKRILKENYQDIVAVEDSEHYAISYEQLRLWLLSLDEKASTAYNMSFHTELEEELDFELFKKAVWSTLSRHEILRTIFKEDQTGEVRQWVLSVEELNFAIDYLDLRQESDQELQLEAYINKKLNTPFNLSEGPLISVSYLLLADKQVLFYSMHHIISDAWSMDVLTKDVIKYYNAYCQHKVPNDELLRIQYKDYANWQIKELGTMRAQQQSAYWKTLFKDGVNRVKFPFEKQRPENFTYTGNRVEFMVNPEQKELLSAVSNSNSGSMYITFLFLVKLIVYKYCSDQKVMIGSSFSTRHHSELENQMGFYVNNLPVISTINKGENLTDLYNSVKNTVLNVNSNSWFPLELVLDEIKYKHDRSYSGLFNVFVEYHQESRTAHTGDPTKGSFKEEFVFDYDIPCLFDLSLEFLEKQDHIHCILIYNNSLFDKKQIELFIDRFLNMVDQLTFKDSFFDSKQIEDLSLDIQESTDVFQSTLFEENF